MHLSRKTSNEFQPSIPNASHYARLYLFKNHSSQFARVCIIPEKSTSFFPTRWPHAPFLHVLRLEPLVANVWGVPTLMTTTLSRPRIASLLPLSPLFVVYESVRAVFVQLSHRLWKHVFLLFNLKRLRQVRYKGLGPLCPRLQGTDSERERGRDLGPVRYNM